ncbi:ATP-binding protein [Cyanobium sp. CH-040]|uniref:ATP-binding protein n=1 Tax=Cyanobium sp. CH-040 TaxID=2823708 RepID=UPI0020CF69C7|nr:ATP-binding protein [Cyanobium sp. CH-040]MCP9928348.1 ATP-binding protein [Cyanobium sp. CH-040]
MGFTLRLTGHPDEIPGALHALEAWLGSEGVSDEDRGEWRLLAEEVLMNIVQHGSPPQAAESIRIDGRFHGDGVELRVEDRGRPFDPCAAPPPDLSAPLEVRRAGGLGVHLLRSLTDEMAYAYRDGRNVLTLRKRSPAAPGPQRPAQPEAGAEHPL